MSKERDPFTDVRRIPSGRYQARYRPRRNPHKTRTFDTEQEAREWLEKLRERKEKEGVISHISKRHSYQTENNQCDCTPGSNETGWHEVRGENCRKKEKKEWRDFMDRVPSIVAKASLTSNINRLRKKREAVIEAQNNLESYVSYLVLSKKMTKTEAAEELQVGRTTIYNYIKRSNERANRLMRGENV